MSRLLALLRQHLEQDHYTKVAQITSTVKLWIEADPRIQAGGSDSLVLIEAGPGPGYTSQVPHTSRGVMVLLTSETSSDDIISAVRIEDENGFC